MSPGRTVLGLACDLFLLSTFLLYRIKSCFPVQCAKLWCVLRGSSLIRISLFLSLPLIHNRVSQMDRGLVWLLWCFSSGEHANLVLNCLRGCEVPQINSTLHFKAKPLFSRTTYFIYLLNKISFKMASTFNRTIKNWERQIIHQRKCDRTNITKEKNRKINTGKNQK